MVSDLKVEQSDLQEAFSLCQLWWHGLIKKRRSATEILLVNRHQQCLFGLGLKNSPFEGNASIFVEHLCSIPRRNGTSSLVAKLMAAPFLPERLL